MACAQHDDVVPTEVETRIEQTKTEQQLCEQCEQEKPIKAFCVECQEYLCEECSIHHCRPRRMRHHRLLKENEMPRKKATVSEHCVKHSDEINKFYCETHTTCCCPVCAITLHKNCELKALSDITKNYLTSEEYGDSKKDLMLVDKSVRNQIENIEKELELGEKSVNAALEELSKHRNVINKHFDKLEKELKSEAHDVQIENSTKMESLTESCNVMLIKLEQMKDDLSVLEDTKQEKLLFAAVKANEKPTRQIKASIEKMEADTMVRQVKFCKNRISNSMTIRKDLLGYLQVFDTEPEIRKGDEVDGSKFTDEKEVSHENTKEDAEKKAKEDDINSAIGNIPVTSCKNCEAGNFHFNCSIYTDFGVLPKLLLLSSTYGAVLEYCKSKLSILSDNSNEPINIIFSTGPWDMDKVAENSLAVTLPLEKKIKFMYVDANKIEEEDEIATPGFCRCIAVADKAFVVTFSEPAGIKLIDRSGEVLKNLMLGQDGTTLFEAPSSVAVADRYIFVTDSNTRTITRMNLVNQENTTRKFKRFKPSYICYSNKNLIVSSCGGTAIAKMTRDLKIKKMSKLLKDEVIENIRVLPNETVFLNIFKPVDDVQDEDDDSEDSDESDDDENSDKIKVHVEKSSDVLDFNIKRTVDKKIKT